jgi:hypothetical protein
LLPIPSFTIIKPVDPPTSAANCSLRPAVNDNGLVSSAMTKETTPERNASSVAANTSVELLHLPIKI